MALSLRFGATNEIAQASIRMLTFHLKIVSSAFITTSQLNFQSPAFGMTVTVELIKKLFLALSNGVPDPRLQ
jgi:hypothetical protein